MINISALYIAHDPTLFESSVSSLDSGEMNISGVKSRTRKGRVSAKELAERLKIPLGMYQKTNQATNQLAVRTVEEPSLTRKCSTNDQMLRYVRLACDTFMDTFFSSKKSGSSERGYTSCQVFDTEFQHDFVSSMEGKSEIKIAQAIKKYFKEICLSLHLICNQDREQVRGDARLI